MSESYSCGVSEKPLLGCTVGQLLNIIAFKYPKRDALVAFQKNPYGKEVLSASASLDRHEGLVSDEPNSYRETETNSLSIASTSVLRYTWREFVIEVNKLAKGLMMLGVEHGMRVAIWALNYAEWVLVQFATAKIGAVMVNINPSYRTFELEYALKQSEVDTLILQGKFKTSDYVGMFYEACPEAFESRPGNIRSQKFPHLRNVVFMGEITYNGMYRWSEVLEMGEYISDEELEEREDSVEFDDALNIQYTSGTTGFPKGVTLSHHSVLNNGMIIGDGMGFTENDKLCIPVPFYHCFGMVLSNMACVTHGTTMVIPGPAFDAEAVLHAVETEKCTALHGVPTMFISELEHPNFSKYDLSSLRTGIMAGSPCPIEKMREVSEKMYMKDIVIVYGQTETAPGVTMSTTSDSLEMRVSTVGRAFPHTEIKIIDPKTGKVLPYGETGEICARGYCTMKGYYNNPMATRQVIDENHWLHSGDLGTMDKDGYVRMVGRLKEMVIRGGENIYPREIEEFFHQHPRVMGVVSRGGSFHTAMMIASGDENPLYSEYDYLLEILDEYNITLSLGDGMRPGAYVDSVKLAKTQEYLTLGKLARRAYDKGIQRMIEGPGHMDYQEIPYNIKMIKEITNHAPLYLLGPLVTDTAPGYDHITGAVGGAAAASAGADFLCMVSPSEHLALPDINNIIEGTRTAKIAARVGDLSRKREECAAKEQAMAEARKSLDWEKQYSLALFGDHARKVHDRDGICETCSMCGDLCALKIVDEALSRRI